MLQPYEPSRRPSAPRANRAIASTVAVPAPAANTAFGLRRTNSASAAAPNSTCSRSARARAPTATEAARWSMPSGVFEPARLDDRARRSHAMFSFADGRGSRWEHAHSSHGVSSGGDLPHVGQQRHNAGSAALDSRICRSEAPTAVLFSTVVSTTLAIWLLVITAEVDDDRAASRRLQVKQVYGTLQVPGSRQTNASKNNYLGLSSR
eukprot:7386213-Prymnesium_polylepis.2